MKKDTYQKILQSQVIPIIREKTFERAQEQLQLALDLGFKIIEITYTIPNAGKLITFARQQQTDLLIGAGSILEVSQLENALNCGADFIVSPHFSNQVASYCLAKKITYIPGALTPTEIINAYSQGFKFVKVFPANAINPALFKAIKAILPELKIMATGGIIASHIIQWKQYPIDVFGLGSDLFLGTKNNIIKKVKQLDKDLNAKK